MRIDAGTSGRMARTIITGATGYIARHTLQRMLERGVAPTELILVTRSPDQLGELRALGADVRFGDFSDPSSLTHAFAGGQCVLMINPAPESFASTTEQTVAQCGAIDAAASAGVRWCALQSRLAAHPALGGADPEAAQTEAALRASGMHWTILRTAGFADSRGRDARRSIRDGVLTTNGDPDTGARYVTRDDIAAAAAAVVCDIERHAEQTYHLLGPAVSVRDLARVLGELSGRPIDVQVLDDAAYLAQLVARGRLPRIAEMAVVNGKRTRELGLRLECDLPRLIGSPGQSLLDFLRTHRTELVSGSPPPGVEAVLT